jgi:hypothetical protein
MNFHQSKVSVETELPLYSTLKFGHPVKVCAFLQNRPSRLARKRELASDIIKSNLFALIVAVVVVAFVVVSVPPHFEILHNMRLLSFPFLSVYLSICLSTCLPVCLSVCLSACLYVCMSVCLSVRMYVCLSIYLSIYLSICLSVCLSVCLPYYLLGSHMVIADNLNVF